MPIKTKKCKHGTFTFYDNDRYIGKQLDVLGYYSENEVQTLLGLVTRNSVVIDVGANIGAIAVPLARKAEWVFAFEPQPLIAKILRQNMRRNVRRYSTNQIALGERPGWVEVPFYDMDAPDMNTGAVRVVEAPDPLQDRFPAANASIVEMNTIDNIFGGPIDLIKIDVEGMEGDVIRGAERVIKEHYPILYVENNMTDSGALIRQVMDLGYQLCWHLPVLECLTNATHRTLTLSSNMLCLPASAPVEWGRLGFGGPDFWPINSPDDNWHTIPVYAEAIARCGD